MNKLQNIFINIVNKVENNPTPFRRYIFLFFAILVLRLALEFFSSSRLFTFFDVMHIGLWFVFIVTAFLLQLHLFSGENIVKVSKLVITFFTIALTAPIIDLLVSGGHGAKMNYLSINSVKDILWAYITIGGSSLTRGATIGIRIEIVLLVIACFNYVYTKQKSILKGIISAISIYTILFLSGTIPFLLGNIVNKFNLQYQPDDQSTLLLLLVLDLMFLFLIVVRKTATKVFELLKQAPWGVIISTLPILFMGALLAIKNYPDNWTLNPTSLFWFPLLFALVFCFILYISVLKLKKNSSDSMQTLFYWENGLLFFILLISALISTRTFFSATLVWGLLFMINEAPLKLGKVPFLGSLLNAMAILSVAFVGFTTFGGPMIGFPHKWILTILTTAFFIGILAEKVNPDKRQWIFLCVLPLSLFLAYSAIA